MMESILQGFDKEIVVAKNGFLCRQGDCDTNVYWVKSGSIRVFVVKEEQEQNIRLGYEGNLLVAMDSFLTGKATQYYIQALKKSRIGVQSYSKFKEFVSLENNKEVWIAMLEQLVVQQLEREFDLLIHSPSERYNRVLQRSPQLFQHIPHRHISNYLRMTPETLSRLKKS
jgi:CRP-like cAMP-binding protein